jgi:DNA-binding response OmpR family regulator
MVVAKKKILIIEDEKPIARALELKFIHAGFSAQSVINGEEGIALLQKNTFDLVLLDLVMPKMDGFHVLEQIKELKLNTPVIILSNLSQAEDEKKAKQLGARDFFIKSNIPIANIVERVKNILK